MGSDYFRRIRFFIRVWSDDGVATQYSHTTTRSTTRVEPRGGIASDDEDFVCPESRLVGQMTMWRFIPE